MVQYHEDQSGSCQGKVHPSLYAEALDFGKFGKEPMGRISSVLALADRAKLGKKGAHLRKWSRSDRLIDS